MKWIKTGLLLYSAEIWAMGRRRKEYGNMPISLVVGGPVNDSYMKYQQKTSF